MKKLHDFLNLFVIILIIGITNGAIYGLDILLTNDDGWEIQPGVPTPIQVLYGALLADGHQVTCVIPAENQSGTGGSLNTGVGKVVPIVQKSDNVYLVPSTPTDCIRAALGALGIQPDLIISGPNFAQNIGMQASSASGTVNAAILGAAQNIPSIAVSIGVIWEEYPQYPSTFAAYEPSAKFVVNLINLLDKNTCHGRILPIRTLLNVNIPVPYDDISGIAITKLAKQSDMDFVWIPDPNGSLGGMIVFKSQLGEVPEELYSDQYAFNNNNISISVLDPNMTIYYWRRCIVKRKLLNLKP